MSNHRELRYIAAQTFQERKGQEFVSATVAKLRALPYVKYLRTVHWRSFRATVLHERDWCCEQCGERYGEIDVHHLNYERIGCEDRADVMVLCRKCHGREHI